jgi:hypothetical protein
MSILNISIKLLKLTDYKTPDFSWLKSTGLYTLIGKITYVSFLIAIGSLVLYLSLFALSKMTNSSKIKQLAPSGIVSPLLYAILIMAAPGCINFIVKLVSNNF